MKPHDKIAGWLVDDDGNIFTRVTEFTCPNHPHGPPDVDEDDPFVAVVIGLWHELDSAAAIHTVSGVTEEVALDTRERLGLCCRGHRWRDTGELREVSALEIFMRLNMPAPVDLSKSVLLNELNRADLGTWQGVRIPLILSVPVHRAGDGPQQIFPNHYSLDPAKPPTVE